ncbi:hypothetical protein pb186bvf_013082 [Paramecium bursaria]
MNFKRNENKKSQEDPYKGLFGHNELDAIFCNSILKGQIVVIEKDYPTTLYKWLIRNSIGNSYHNKQTTLIIDRYVEQWTKYVPMKSNIQESNQNEKQVENKIAWRYQSNTVNQKLKNNDSYLIQQDLTKHEKNPDLSLFKTYEWQEDDLNVDAKAKQLYKKSLKSSTDSQLKKLIINDVDNLDSQTLFNLKQLVRSSFIVCIMVVQNKCVQRNTLLAFADFYLTVDQIFGNQLFSDFQGLLNIIKVGHFGSYSQAQIEQEKWGIKTKRQLVLEMLYETAVQDDSSDEDKQRLACGANLKDKQVLEF